ncbi:hypothetical protein [Iningainema tapete]|uniref:Uncharacterized protein n=1 Tax=Iningainema tapete BLCC-T55 TaxID=2748662 RepID=A0A8J6XP13_9CYAN|nr:hypothetical protein [Iningainema tapete]MBD2776787.1 hypothetical protein [Iningainema tapete BLCC-T55]
MAEEKIQPNAQQAPTQDAQLAAERIASGEEKAPTVDMEADYQAAQQLSTSSIDRTPEGAKAATEATAPQQQVSQPEETKTTAQPTGNPDDYLEMAKDVNTSTQEGESNVSDDLVKKALENKPKK